MGVYRITTRFDLSNEAEKRAADYLKSLKHGEGNRFVIDAVLAQIDGDDTRLVEQLRQMFREEIRAIAVSSAATIPVASVEQPTEPQADTSVLDDLKLFD